MSFFKRISRTSRNSYADDDYEVRPRSKEAEPAKYAELEEPRLSSYSQAQHNSFPPGTGNNTNPPSPTKETNREMYRNINSQDGYSQKTAVNSRQNSAAFDANPVNKLDIQTPDLLARAFNEAIRPHTDKIQQLEMQLADMQQWVKQLESQQSEMYTWIDKRGLRPDVPPSIAKAMDSQPDSAQALNNQLDRKITIVNFDLHRLQDDLNDSISASHFAAAMSKFLPDIKRLSSLPSGPRCAFDLVLKLGGNLNSHGLLAESSTADDLAARKDFYAQLDAAMVAIVRRRFEEAGDDWPVAREIKRIEKTAAYLRNFGIEPYFPATLDAMRQEVDYQMSAPPGASAAAGADGSGGVAHAPMPPPPPAGGGGGQHVRSGSHSTPKY